jgi:hypothetical protein
MRRWVSIVAGQFVMLMCGTAYLFSIFSNTVRANLDLSEVEVNQISTIIYCGMNELALNIQ